MPHYGISRLPIPPRVSLRQRLFAIAIYSATQINEMVERNYKGDCLSGGGCRSQKKRRKLARQRGVKLVR